MRISSSDLSEERNSFKRHDYKFVNNILLPDNFNEMCVIASKLAKESNISFIRIDLYFTLDKIYFQK